MPSIFITKVNSGASIPSFVKKGIPNHMPGVVGEIPIYVESLPPTLSIHHFKYLAYAIMMKCVIVADAILHTNLFQSMLSVPTIFEMPVSSFRFQGLSPAQIGELKGMGLQQDLTNGNLGYS
jgi:hypothetical protein